MGEGARNSDFGARWLRRTSQISTTSGQTNWRSREPGPGALSSFALPGARAPRARMRALRDAVRAVAASPTPPPDARAFASALSLLSVAYGRVSAARRWAYEVGLLTATSVPAPVVSVGNVTWGGSGKTPMAELVAREMAAAGATPAVLSRGYRGGDEAWMLRRRLADVRGARVLVGADRVKLALEALAGRGGDDARRAPKPTLSPLSRAPHPRPPPVAFAREAKFAGDVDDDVALRASTRRRRRDDGGGERTSTTAAPLASSARPPVPRDPSVAALVLDDGAQHLRLRRDLEIITVNAISRWGPAAVPRGPLRNARDVSAAPTSSCCTTPTSREPSTRRRPRRSSARSSDTWRTPERTERRRRARRARPPTPPTPPPPRRRSTRRFSFARRCGRRAWSAWPVTSAPRLRTSGRRR